MVDIHGDSSLRVVPPGTAHLWLFWLDTPGEAALPGEAARPGAGKGRSEVLDAGERDRAAAMSDPVRRYRFVAAHTAARFIVAGYLGISPHRLRWLRTANGKPAVAGAALGVNLSHSGALGALAVTGGRPVGVDVQRVATGADAVRMAHRYFPPEEAGWVAAAPDTAARARRFAVLWARKEACVKAAGARLMHGMRVPVRDGGVVRAGDGPLRGTFAIKDVPVPAGFHGAVALCGRHGYRVRTRWYLPDPR